MIHPKDPLADGAVADHYDELDPFYREIWGEHVHHGLWLEGHETLEEATENLARHVARHAGIGQGSRVCDVGCGYGATARLLGRDLGARVTGITLSRAQYERAVAQPEGHDFVLGDWTAGGLPANAFDAVIAIESTEHMADKSACFAEAHRVLVPGGHLVVCAWLAGPHARAWQISLLLEPICREGRLHGMGSSEEYTELLCRADFDRVTYEDCTSQVKRTWPICIRRTASGLCRRPEYRRFLRSRLSRNRHFVLTLLRILLAYETGAMVYGLFTGRKAA